MIPRPPVHAHRRRGVAALLFFFLFSPAGDEDDEDFCPSSIGRSGGRKSRGPSVCTSKSASKKPTARGHGSQEAAETKETLQLSRTKGGTSKRIRRKPRMRKTTQKEDGVSNDLQQMAVPVSIVEKEEGQLTAYPMMPREESSREGPGAGRQRTSAW